MSETILCLNTGSSSVKFALYDMGGGRERLLASGAAEGVSGHQPGRVWLRSDQGQVVRSLADPNRETALAECFALLDERHLPPATRIAHRIVHGGSQHTAPVLIDGAVLAELRTLAPLAPLHLPAAIAGIEAAQARAPGVPQIAAFDTAFHARMPEVARRFALPDALYASGVRRYGFHGLSFEFVLSALGEPPPPRVIVAHLGNGSSLAAVRDGIGIDTTMGLTPTGGIPMGTRSGDLDPGVIFYLARQGYSLGELERLVTEESGLLGISGTADVVELLKRRGTDERARLALDVFAYAIRKAIGAFAFALGGLDTLVFTGGIGENAAVVRALACHGLEGFGIRIDGHRNEANAQEIQAADSATVVRVIHTDEDLMLARHARDLSGLTPANLQG